MDNDNSIHITSTVTTGRQQKVFRRTTTNNSNRQQTLTVIHAHSSTFNDSGDVITVPGSNDMQSMCVNIRGDGVDAKRVKDNTCKVRDGSECMVGWWDPGKRNI